MLKGPCLGADLSVGAPLGFVYWDFRKKNAYLGSIFLDQELSPGAISK
jgi:hypothetical protein